MADTIPGGASFDLSNSTFHGPVFNNAVFQEALTITHALQAAPAEQKALADALETLRRALAGLPEVRRPEAAASAEAVIKLAGQVRGWF